MLASATELLNEKKHKDMTAHGAPEIMYGTAWKEGRTTELVEKALSVGFTGIDTANQPRHYKESLVGNALHSFLEQGGSRQDLFVQTKFTPVAGQDSRIPYDPKADIQSQVRQSFESSLADLRTDYVDSYLLHAPHSFPELADADWEVWSVMEELYRSGRARSVGISNVNRQQLVSLCEKANLRPAIVQNRCFAKFGWDRAVREVCRTFGVTYQGFSLLTGNPAMLRHPKVAELAEKLGKTPQQVIYRFAMQAGMVPLTGTTNSNHMKEALAAVDFEISEDDVEAIEEAQG